MPDNNQRRTQSVYPTLAFRGECAKALEFYKTAFGAKINAAMKAPSGHIVHAELALGTSVLMASDEFPTSPVKAPAGGVTGGFYVYVDDVDAFIKKAVAAGAKPTMPLTDMFYGDRIGGLVDPFGYHWTIGTHKEDVPPAEVERRAKEMFAAMGKPK